MSETPTVTVDDLHELREVLTASFDSASLRPLGLREVVRGCGAVATLPQVLGRLGIAPGSNVTVLSDTTPKSYDGRDVLDVVLHTLRHSHAVELVQVTPATADTIVLADEGTISYAVDSAQSSSPCVLVSVGSGTVVDIGKVVAKELNVPHVVVQTAASVNGFADDQSVLLINGVKRTTPSRWPDSLIIDPWVVAQAPVAMTRSGLGDQLSMFTAAADWYLSTAIGFDTSYSSTITSLMRRDIEPLLAAAGELGSSETEALNLLASCLTVGGLSMGVAGRTAPSSGTEHLVSHLLEMHADANHVPNASHGSQVGVSSVLAAVIWQQVRVHLSSGEASVTADGIASREHVLEAFSHLDESGKLASECWVAYERKATWLSDNFDKVREFVNEWPRHELVISTLLEPPSKISTTLRSAKAPTSFAQLNPAPSNDVVLWAVTNGYLMRDRFCVVDLAVLMDAWNPETINTALKQLHELAQ
jgi:glycerol-1-phosphate dehydrogenase [NAD(P)+]